MFNLALYGAGNRTKALVNALISDDFYRIHSVYDLNSAASQALADEYNCKECPSPEELLASGADAFLISLSPFAHARALREVIPLGKPVFVEKPVSFSSREILELKLLAEKYHTPVQVGFMRRYLPESRALLDYIRTNESGDLYCIDCHWSHHGDTEMNYFLQYQKDNFRLKVSQIPFHCCHMLDIMLLVGGKVKRVNSQLIKWSSRPYPSPDDVLANIEFASGSNGHFHYSSNDYGSEMSYKMFFENYTLRIAVNDAHFTINHRPRFKTSQIGPKPGSEAMRKELIPNYEMNCKPEVRNYSQWLSHANENIMYDFVQTVEKGIMPESDLNAALRVQGLAEAIEEGGRSRKDVFLDDLGMPIKE